MKCTLVFPPTADPTQPYSSLPCLAAFLRDRGRHTVNLIDANVAFFRALLTRSSLIEAQDRVRERLFRLDQQERLSPEDAKWYARAVQSLLKAPFIIDGVAQAVNEISSAETFYSIAHLNDCKRIVHEAAELLSCAWAPISFKLGSASDLHFAGAADVGLMVSDSGNPFRDFLKTDTLQAIGAAEAIGISITYRDQILPAFTLSSLIRHYLPTLPVIFGGNLPSIWYETLEDHPDLFDWCDYLIAFEGETALDELLRAIETGASLKNVPNLAYRRNDAIIKTFFYTEQINRLPAPDYDQLPLNRYFAPKPALFVYATRGCYWSRCEFCSVSPSMQGHSRGRDPELIHRDISTLYEKYHTRYFAFADDCVPPKALQAISELLIEKGPKVRWQCEVRFESALDQGLLYKLKEAGCVNLIFGLESFSETVLKKMNKGIGPDLIRKVLDDCRQVGIAFNLQFFFGFPGETKADAEITMHFIEDQVHGPATFSFGTYELHRNSGIHRNPHQHNISIEDTHNSLSIVLAYAPHPPHAVQAKAELQKKLRQRTRFPYAGLSLNAHTIILLSQAGIQALSELYHPYRRRPPQWTANMAHAVLEPGSHQHIESFKFSPEALLGQKNSNADNDYRSEKSTILYDYNSDRSVEISDLTVSVMAQLSMGMTLHQIIEEFKTKLDGADAQKRLGYVLAKIVQTLYEKGFLVNSAPILFDNLQPTTLTMQDYKAPSYSIRHGLLK